jgi:hypothetical protein
MGGTTICCTLQWQSTHLACFHAFLLIAEFGSDSLCWFVEEGYSIVHTFGRSDTLVTSLMLLPFVCLQCSGNIQGQRKWGEESCAVGTAMWLPTHWCVCVCVCLSLSLFPSFRVFWVLLLSVDSHFCFRQFLLTIMCRLKTQNGGVLGIGPPTARQEPSVGPKFTEQPCSRSLPGGIKNQ